MEAQGNDANDDVDKENCGDGDNGGVLCVWVALLPVVVLALIFKTALARCFGRFFFPPENKNASQDRQTLHNRAKKLKNPFSSSPPSSFFESGASIIVVFARRRLPITITGSRDGISVMINDDLRRVKNIYSKNENAPEHV
jgi:hypothetical protein